MKGKIILYNQNEGTGKIITEEGVKYTFDVDGWADYDVLPQVGLEVIFSLEGQVPISIKVGQLQQELYDKTASHSHADTAYTSSRSLPQKAGQAAKSEELISDITANKPLSECLDEYFGDYYDIIKRNADDLSSQKKLDFFMMKRFLNTAYHNLKQIDRSISEGKFKEIENELKFLHKIYNSFVKITSLPQEVAYEMIYLENQENYKNAQGQAKHLKTKMDTSKRVEKGLKNDIERLEMQLKDGELSPEKIKELESEVKPIRREYTDALFNAGKSKEDLVTLTKTIDEFKKSHYEEFAKLFSEHVAYLKDKLIKILNVKAYWFDYMLWANAKESPYIRKFFTECKIEGSYCSKTFLNYYLKSLDKDKLTEDNQKLFGLLKYLEENFTKRVIVLTKDLDYAEYIKILVEKIDKDMSVQASTSPVDMINFAKRHVVDIVILEMDLRLMDAFEFMKNFNEQVSFMPDFCVIYDRTSSEMVEKAALAPAIKKMIKKQTKERDMLELLKRII